MRQGKKNRGMNEAKEEEKKITVGWVNSRRFIRCAQSDMMFESHGQRAFVISALILLMRLAMQNCTTSCARWKTDTRTVAQKAESWKRRYTTEAMIITSEKCKCEKIRNCRRQRTSSSTMWRDSQWNYIGAVNIAMHREYVIIRSGARRARTAMRMRTALVCKST